MPHFTVRPNRVKVMNMCAGQARRDAARKIQHVLCGRTRESLMSQPGAVHRKTGPVVNDGKDVEPVRERLFLFADDQAWDRLQAAAYRSRSQKWSAVWTRTRYIRLNGLAGESSPEARFARNRSATSSRLRRRSLFLTAWRRNVSRLACLILQPDHDRVEHAAGTTVECATTSPAPGAQ